MSSLPACPLCSSGGEGLRAKYRLKRFKVLQCRACTAVFVETSAWESLNPHGWPASVGEEQASYYEEHFRAFRERTYSRALDVVESLAATGPLLDVGAGFGTFVHLARARGWEAQGVEPDEAAVEWNLRRGGLELIRGTIFEEGLQVEHYRALTLWDVLEHLPDPRAALMRARHLLAPGGVLVFRTPVEDALLPAFYRVLYHGTRGRVTAPLEKVFEFHLWHFRTTLLERLVRECGFRTVTRYREPWVNRNALHQKEWARSRVIRFGFKAAMAMASLLRAEDEVVWIAAREG